MFTNKSLSISAKVNTLGIIWFRMAGEIKESSVV